MLMLFAELNRNCPASARSAIAAFTSDWQSSNAPVTERDSTLSLQQVS